MTRPLVAADAGGAPPRAPVDRRVLEHLLDESLSPAALAELPPEARLASSGAERPALLGFGAARENRQYKSRVSLFAAWCAARGLRAMPAHPEALRLYLLWLAANGHAWSTIKVSHMAVGAAHRAHGHDVPASERLRSAVRQLRKGLTPARRVWPISPATLRAILTNCPRDALGTRDRALLLITYSARLLPSESVALDLDAAERRPEGYVLRVRRTPSRREDRVQIPVEPDTDFCCVRALDDWIEAYAHAANLHPPRGPLFVAVRGGHGYPVVIGGRIAARTILRVLRRRAIAAGIDPALVSVQGLRPDDTATAPSRG